MTGKYILDGKTPVVASDLPTWARWFETANRIVKQTPIADDIRVSTVFLGLDHSWGKGAPLLFETMCFGGPLDEAQDRYSTWQEAEEGHKAMIAQVRAAMRACGEGEACRQLAPAPDPC